MTMNAFKQRNGLAVAMLVAAVALTACGGGKQVKKFVPSNIVSFGDESSAFVPESTLETGTGSIKGLKYTVNDIEFDVRKNLIDPPLLDTDVIVLTQWQNEVGYPFLAATAVGLPEADTANGIVKRVFSLPVAYTPARGSLKTETKNVTFEYLYNCGQTVLGEANRLWIQTLASSYGMSYDQSCPLDPRGKALTYAAAGAKVADVATQISANIGAVTSNTLVTVLAGQNDILAQYEALYPAPGTGIPTEGAISQAVSVLKSSGQQLGQAVNTMANKGARVLVVTVPDLSYSPRVGADAGKKAVMQRLLVAFNEAIFGNGGARVDGHLIGLVNGFESIGNMAKSPSAYGLINASAAVCASNGRSINTVSAPAITTIADVKYCNDQTLVTTSATAYNYLWAFDTWLTPRGHDVLAGIAFARADNDTF